MVVGSLGCGGVGLGDEVVAVDVGFDEGVVWVAFFDGLGVGAVVVGEVVGGLAV